MLSMDHCVHLITHSILTPSLEEIICPRSQGLAERRTKPLRHHVSMADQLLENVETAFRPRIEKCFFGNPKQRRELQIIFKQGEKALICDLIFYKQELLNKIKNKIKGQGLVEPKISL